MSCTPSWILFGKILRRQPIKQIPITDRWTGDTCALTAGCPCVVHAANRYCLYSRRRQRKKYV